MVNEWTLRTGELDVKLIRVLVGYQMAVETVPDVSSDDGSVFVSEPVEEFVRSARSKVFAGAEDPADPFRSVVNRVEFARR